MRGMLLHHHGLLGWLHLCKDEVRLMVKLFLLGPLLAQILISLIPLGIYPRHARDDKYEKAHKIFAKRKKDKMRKKQFNL
jgi:hypothetical protein